MAKLKEIKFPYLKEIPRNSESFLKQLGKLFLRQKFIGHTEWNKVDSKPDELYQIFYQATAPASGMDTGDFWIDSDDNKIYRYSGASWVEVQDDDIAQAISDAATAQSTADGKIYVYKQASAPDSGMGTGDIWFDTDDGNKPYRYSGSEWEAVPNPSEWADVLDGATTKPDDNATEGAKAGTDLKKSDETVLGDTDVIKLMQNVYGDGSDGNVDINSSSFSSGPISSNALTRDAFFNNLTLSGGNLNTAGFRLFVKGTLIIDSGRTLHRNGNNGGNGGNGVYGGSGGDGGSAASALGSGSLPAGIAGIIGGEGGGGRQAGENGPAGIDAAKSIGSGGGNGVAGGKGGQGWDGGGGQKYTGANGGAAGSGGSQTGTVFNKIRNFVSAYMLADFLPSFAMLTDSAGTGGAGGGGGGGAFSSPTPGAGGGGGGSGSTGGIIFIAAKTIVNNGNIRSHGGSGGDGGNGSNSMPGAGGGGAGGAGGSGGTGGVIILIYNIKTGSDPTVTGGSGGSGGSPGDNGNEYGDLAEAGSNGSTGASGKLIKMQV